MFFHKINAKGMYAVICSHNLICKIQLSSLMNKEIFFQEPNLRQGIYCALKRNHATCVLERKSTWNQPEGYDTGIVVWHPSVGKKVPLVLQRKKIAKW